MLQSVERQVGKFGSFGVSVNRGHTALVVEFISQVSQPAFG